MPTVTIHQAKTNLSRLIERASAGEEIIIARGSKPVARLVPVGAVKGKRQPGSGRASLSSAQNFLSLFLTTNSRAGSRLLARTLDTHTLLWWILVTILRCPERLERRLRKRTTRCS